MKLRYKIKGIFKLSAFGTTAIVYSVDLMEARKFNRTSDMAVLRTSAKEIQTLKIFGSFFGGRANFDTDSVQTFEDVVVSEADLGKETHFIELEAELMTEEDHERMRQVLYSKKKIVPES